MAGKPIRLGKAASELSVGIPTIVEFLHSKGIKVDSNPNTRLESEHFELLLQEFAADQNLKKQSEALASRREKRETISIKNKTQDEKLVEIEDEDSEEVNLEEIKKLVLQYAPSRPLLTSELQISQQQFSKYFDLSILNDELFSSGEVEGGKHGLEIIDGEYYATLYHIKNQLSKRGLKTFLNQQEYNENDGLNVLGRTLKSSYKFQSIYVKYSNLDYKIKKYPLKVVLDYYIKNLEIDFTSYPSFNNEKTQLLLAEIEVKNFGRFIKEKKINFSDVNFFVGPNNSGKSTIVYAISLFLNLLSGKDQFNIRWRNENYSNKTFGDVLNRNVKLNETEFVQIGGKFLDSNFKINVHDSEDATHSSVISLEIDNPLFRMVIDNKGFDKKISFFSKSSSDNKSNELRKLREKLNLELKEINNRLNKTDSNSQILSLVNEKSKIEKQIKNVVEQIKKSGNSDLEENGVVFEIDLFEFNSDNVYSIFEYMIKMNESQLKLKGSNNLKSARMIFDRNKNKYSQYFKKIEAFSSEFSYSFIEGSAVKFPRLLTIGNQHDTFIGCIKYLKSHLIFENEGHWIMKFIEKWIGTEGFDFGKKIIINDLENNAFVVKIKNNSWEYLGELGLGSQRLFELIINVATILLFKENGQVNETLLMIEEPEAHIHPALQSKLTDFFYEVNNEFGIRFIIETHSEYMIRKSQLIVKNKGYENESDNPFNVVYFEKENGPYEMKYRQDGKFINEFGSGFFDENRNIIKNML